MEQAIPVFLKLPILSSISSSSEGETSAQVSLFQQRKCKTEDCESKTIQVSQRINNAGRIQIMQSNFRHYNHDIDYHANCTSWSYLQLSQFKLSPYYRVRKATSPTASWLLRENANAIQIQCEAKSILVAIWLQRETWNIRVIAIQFRKGPSISAAASAKSTTKHQRQMHTIWTIFAAIIVG